ncbi:class D beta-lactamase [Deefgea salmonis]|uniref:Beta-lactamase n=1 Tax=Deefgea salmonis TaxID=2875502 RepID=A0ABS8BIB0_9NEIS|nr:class D beta-lactamase [Deefgea salmonis]MCB5195331.1 class D beta-lactamase [Deefgea salmonis]
MPARLAIRATLWGVKLRRQSAAHFAALVAALTLCTGLAQAQTLITPQASGFEENSQIAAIFAKQQIQGSIVIFDVSQQRRIGHNYARAATRFFPASTFKIANSLIGLSRKAVSSVDEVFYHYDGQPVYLASWAHDMGLREALRVSNVPAYQQLAKKIGLSAMQSDVGKLNYGNADIGSQVEQFWLKGPLKISPIEQSQFLARLAQTQLPLPQSAQIAVRDIMQLESGKGWTLYGKTGLYRASPADIGWFVGWLEQDGKIYSFALNMDQAKETPLSQRIQLSKDSLQALGLMKN